MSQGKQTSSGDSEATRSFHRADRAELAIILDFYDVMLFLVQRCERFPRHHRHSLGIAIENRIQSILGILIRAKYAGKASKRSVLGVANTELEVLRFQLRLAKDLKVLPLKSYGHASALIEGIGTQLGAWVRSLRANLEPSLESSPEPVASSDELGKPRIGGEESPTRQA